MKVYKYYCDHFTELPEDKRFHFATRMKNWRGDQCFAQYLLENQPSDDLEKLYQSVDSSEAGFYQERKPFFEKYPQLYATQIILFRVKHLLDEYGVDKRTELLKLQSREQLYILSDQLMSDEAALWTLSTFAVNFICLVEILYPRGRDVFTALAEKFFAEERDDLLSIYYLTHVIIGDTDFYVRKIADQRLELYKKALQKCEKIIEKNFATTTLDVKLEFLVCGRIVGFKSYLRERVLTECQEVLATHNFLVDRRKPERCNTFERAEHRNVLFIMSGLDEKLSLDF